MVAWSFCSFCWRRGIGIRAKREREESSLEPEYSLELEDPLVDAPTELGTSGGDSFIDSSSFSGLKAGF